MSLLEKRAKEIIHKGSDPGTCVQCGKVRESEKWAFCQSCADSLYNKTFAGMSPDEIQGIIDKVTLAVNKDIKQTMIDPN